jgi:hypothetical protein
MNKNTTCSSEIIAQGRFSSVTVCRECDLYYLHIGPMSFKLEPDIFESTCHMLAEYHLNRRVENSLQCAPFSKH